MGRKASVTSIVAECFNSSNPTLRISFIRKTEYNMSALVEFKRLSPFCKHSRE